MSTQAYNSYQVYKFGLYPTSQQEGIMAETIETCRRLYKDLMDDRIKNHTGTFEQKRVLTASRKENKYLGKVRSQVLQDVTFRLGKAFGAFFCGLTRFPKFDAVKSSGLYYRVNHWTSGRALRRTAFLSVVFILPFVVLNIVLLVILRASDYANVAIADGTLFAGEAAALIFLLNRTFGSTTITPNRWTSKY